MLTFEQKQAIIESFSELTKKEISLKRLNYHFMDSLYEKTIVVEKLHPNGNGFIFVGDLLRYEQEANKGLVNIRDYDEQQLREIIADAIQYLSEEVETEDPIIEIWHSREGDQLQLVFEQRSWNVYHGENLEEAFGTYDAAKEYLLEEGFRKKK
ncbi:hypothetical protein D0439_01945 [Lysinibacillus fusiformis]|jgi:hypothetical protein|uniref:hypothetical protein n=2 Tax=Bacillaceae TaxID=186817 RepID=UPI0004D7B5AA|nr:MULTISPECIES: hypothetical protein [Lysinibacillus]AXQ50737.1 hypothetical protein DZC31_28830 [Stenotrophomonas rhizophila]AJK86122.1 hypothetical protein HR49_02285 [Lysinibacillus fusiformis]KAB0445472.1 hypothetical protein CH314_02130 [Lysinibacillus fusiformis]KGA81842.1 hypothetical protein KQ41_14105 [Lysinibacillus fusiformis]KHK55630.1 hypothetical protein PI85_02755 [Lysinibacillus sp. A1]